MYSAKKPIKPVFIYLDKNPIIWFIWFCWSVAPLALIAQPMSGLFDLLQCKLSDPIIYWLFQVQNLQLVHSYNWICALVSCIRDLEFTIIAFAISVMGLFRSTQVQTAKCVLYLKCKGTCLKTLKITSSFNNEQV